MTAEGLHASRRLATTYAEVVTGLRPDEWARSSRCSGWMCPPVSTVLDRPLGVRLTGAGGGEWTLLPGESVLTVVPGLQDPVATATSAAEDFVPWGTARTPRRASVEVAGDGQYAARVLDRVDIV